MKSIKSIHVIFVLLFQMTLGALAAPLVYEGTEGVGKGKHIVFIASDHEYRGEETCPAIARILAKRYGFKCTVLFGLDNDGHIKPGSSNVPGIEALDKADMMFLFLRFLRPNDEWMKHFDAYLDRGGPVLGLRTTTHAFNGLKGGYKYYNFNSRSKDYDWGFGRQVLGETWRPREGAGHYGSNHRYSTRMFTVPEQKDHPVMRGVKDMHAMAGAYSAVPIEGSIILGKNQVLDSMKPDGKPLPNKPPAPPFGCVNTSLRQEKKVGSSVPLRVLRRTLLVKECAAVSSMASSGVWGWRKISRQAWTLPLWGLTNQQRLNLAEGLKK